MQKLAKAIGTAGTGIASLIFASPIQAYSYDYSYDTTDSALSAGLCFGNMIVTVCCGLVLLVLFAFNIWMLIDAFQRDEKVLPGKIKWVLVILFVPFASVAYYFMRKRVMDASKKA